MQGVRALVFAMLVLGVAIGSAGCNGDKAAEHFREEKLKAQQDASKKAYLDQVLAKAPLVFTEYDRSVYKDIVSARLEVRDGMASFDADFGDQQTVTLKGVAIRQDSSQILSDLKFMEAGTIAFVRKEGTEPLCALIRFDENDNGLTQMVICEK